MKKLVFTITIFPILFFILSSFQHPISEMNDSEIEVSSTQSEKISLTGEQLKAYFPIDKKAN